MLVFSGAVVLHLADDCGSDVETVLVCDVEDSDKGIRQFDTKTFWLSGPVAPDFGSVPTRSYAFERFCNFTDDQKESCSERVSSGEMASKAFRNCVIPDSMGKPVEDFGVHKAFVLRLRQVLQGVRGWGRGRVVDRGTSVRAGG
jgi:hypothetical protein